MPFNQGDEVRSRNHQGIGLIKRIGAGAKAGAGRCLTCLNCLT